MPIGFSRQEYWSGLPCPPPEDLPDPGIKPESLKSSALASGFLTIIAICEAPYYIYIYIERERERERERVNNFTYTHNKTKQF